MEKSGLIRNWQRTENPWKGLQKTDKKDKSLTLKLFQKKKEKEKLKIHLMILEKLRSCLWELEPGFWTYGGLIRLLGSGAANVVCRPQTPRSWNSFKISWIYWIHLMILEKMRSFLWKLQSGFQTYGKVCLLGPSGPNVVSRLQTPKSNNFLKFCNFIGYILFFWRKWDPVSENSR